MKPKPSDRSRLPCPAKPKPLERVDTPFVLAPRTDKHIFINVEIKPHLIITALASLILVLAAVL